jgi:hypothetical protein
LTIGASGIAAESAASGLEPLVVGRMVERECFPFARA